jgi:hypothetical protein
LKRTRSVGKEVYFPPEMKCTTTKEDFLSSSKKKTKFIENFKVGLRPASRKTVTRLFLGGGA